MENIRQIYRGDKSVIFCFILVEGKANKKIKCSKKSARSDFFYLSCQISISIANLNISKIRIVSIMDQLEQYAIKIKNNTPKFKIFFAGGSILLRTELCQVFINEMLSI